VRLRLMQTVTSADAQVGQTVDFEVSEPVVSQGMVVIPKNSIALGKVTKSEPKKRFGRAGALESNVESVRLADGSRATLRASRDVGSGNMGSGRLAATIAASPVLVWVKGKDVAFEKGMEATAYLNGDARLDEAQLRRGGTPVPGQPSITGPERSADRAPDSAGLTNNDIIQMRKANLSEEVILSKVKSSTADFRTSPQDLIQLKEAGVSDAVITAILEKSKL
jgi:hypothetical protein